MSDSFHFMDILVVRDFFVLEINRLKKILLLNLGVAASLSLATKWKSVDVPTKVE